MDATIITTAEALGMSAPFDANMYTVYNVKHTEGVAVFYDSATCNYVVKHFIHLNDGRTATFNDKVTDDVNDVICTMKEYCEEFKSEQEKAFNTVSLVNFTSKTMDDLIHRWVTSENTSDILDEICGGKKSDAVDEIRRNIIKSLEDVRKANDDFFMERAKMIASVNNA